MKNTVYLLFFGVFLASSVSAQFVSPVPVAEIEMRDISSQKRRALELDRVKKDAKKINTEKLGPASVNNFLEIKADFEKIQLLQSDLVKVYTTGKRIDFARIGFFSGEINLSAAKLKENLFQRPDKDQKNTLQEPETVEKDKNLPQDLPKLIVELDDAIGSFVSNQIFLNPKKAKLKEREKAEADIVAVIKISAALRQEAERRAQPKN